MNAPTRRGQTLVLALLTVFIMVAMVAMTISIGVRAKENAEAQTVADTAVMYQAVSTARVFNGMATLNRVALAHWIALGSMQVGALWHQAAADMGRVNNYDDQMMVDQTQAIYNAIGRVEILQYWLFFDLNYNATMTDMAYNASVKPVTNTWVLDPVPAAKDEYHVVGSQSCREVCHATSDFRGDIFAIQDTDIRESFNAFMGTRNHPLAWGFTGFNTKFEMHDDREPPPGATGPGGMWTHLDAEARVPFDPRLRQVSVSSAQGARPLGWTQHTDHVAGVPDHTVSGNESWITLYSNNGWDDADRVLLASQNLMHRIDNRTDMGYNDRARADLPRTIHRGSIGFIDYTDYPANNPPDYGLIGCSAAGGPCMKGPYDAYGMPKLSIALSRDARFRGSKPWEMLFNFRFSRTGPGGRFNTKTPDNPELAPAVYNMQYRFAAGMAYYHRRVPGRNGFTETPNMLNPFWRATLVPMDIDQHGKPTPGSSAIKSTFISDRHNQVWAAGHRPGDIGSMMCVGGSPEIIDFYDDFAVSRGHYHGVY